MLTTPYIFDFDNSVLPLPGEVRLPLAKWHDRLRLAGGRKHIERFELELMNSLPAELGPVFLGSSDFHYISRFLLGRQSIIGKAIDVIILANRPANLRYPFGIHANSWVLHACGIPNVRHIHVVGITSDEMSFKHSWRHHLMTILMEKVTYWSIGTPTKWISRIFGLGDLHRNFESADSLVEAFTGEVQHQGAYYLSLDKSVFSPEVAKTNQHQGCFMLPHVQAIIEKCKESLAGADICGDVSLHDHAPAHKTLFSRRGNQPESDEQLALWQKEQQQLNVSLLSMLDGAGL